jgi:hypothetical protein
MGDYIYIPSGKSFEIMNGGDSKNELAFFELK